LIVNGRSTENKDEGENGVLLLLLEGNLDLVIHTK